MEDKSQEHLSDVTGEGYSSCCGAGVYEFGDSYMCMDCKEWCDMETEEEDEILPKSNAIHSNDITADGLLPPVTGSE